MKPNNTFDEQVLSVAVSLVRDPQRSKARLARTIAFGLAVAIASSFAVPYLASQPEEPWQVLAGFIAVLAALVLIPGAIALGGVVVAAHLRSHVQNVENSVLEMRMVVLQEVARDFIRVSPPDISKKVLARHREEIEALPPEFRRELLGVSG